MRQQRQRPENYTVEQWAHSCRVAARVAQQLRTQFFHDDNDNLEKDMEYLALMFEQASTSWRSDGALFVLPMRPKEK